MCLCLYTFFKILVLIDNASLRTEFAKAQEEARQRKEEEVSTHYVQPFSIFLFIYLFVVFILFLKKNLVVSQDLAATKALVDKMQLHKLKTESSKTIMTEAFLTYSPSKAAKKVVQGSDVKSTKKQ